MWLALFMAALVLAGTSWFFRDQLRSAWLSYQLKDDETKPTEQAPAVPDATPPALNGSNTFNPTATASPPVIPAANLTVPPPPPVTVMPAIPAPSTPPPAQGGLVEVPATPSPGPPVNVIPSSTPRPPVVTGITAEARPALDALLQFFHAATWTERLSLVQSPEAMKPIMEQYYAANPDGALHPSHINLMRHDKAPETGPPHCVFEVSGGGLKQTLPVMVEDSGAGWQVDWLTFTEFKDELLQKFLAAPQPVPARFHVLMRRAHYFDDDIPALDKKICFQVMVPMPGFTGDVFAPKGASLARELDKFLGWDVSQAAAVVELQWRKEDRYQWVELTNVVQLNWRNGEPPPPIAPKAVPVQE